MTINEQKVVNEAVNTICEYNAELTAIETLNFSIKMKLSIISKENREMKASLKAINKITKDNDIKSLSEVTDENR